MLKHDDSTIKIVEVLLVLLLADRTNTVALLAHCCVRLRRRL